MSAYALTADMCQHKQNCAHACSESIFKSDSACFLRTLNTIMLCKRQCLTLKKKFKIIEYVKRKKASLRKISQNFSDRKTLIGSLLQGKNKIEELWHSNSNENAKRTKLLKINYIDYKVFDWFCTDRVNSQLVYHC